MRCVLYHDVASICVQVPIGYNTILLLLLLLLYIVTIVLRK